MFADPLNDTPAIVLAFCKVVAVRALPVQDPDEPDVLPVTLPVTLPTNAPDDSVIPAAANVASVDPSIVATIDPVPLSVTATLELPCSIVVLSTAVVVADVIRPLASTVTIGIAVDDPYVAADTPEAARVIAPPEDAVASPEVAP